MDPHRVAIASAIPILMPWDPPAESRRWTLSDSYVRTMVEAGLLFLRADYFGHFGLNFPAVAEDAKIGRFPGCATLGVSLRSFSGARNFWFFSESSERSVGDLYFTPPSAMLCRFSSGQGNCLFFFAIPARCVRRFTPTNLTKFQRRMCLGLDRPMIRTSKDYIRNCLTGVPRNGVYLLIHAKDVGHSFYCGVAGAGRFVPGLICNSFHATKTAGTNRLLLSFAAWALKHESVPRVLSQEYLITG